MMIQIQTTEPVIYDARGNKLGTVVLQLDLKPGPDKYTATIQDLVKKSTTAKNEDGEDITTDYLEPICSKTITLSTDEVNTLFEAVKGLIPAGLPYTERELRRTEQAFLFYVQNDFLKDDAGRAVPGKTIYNVDPDKWVIVT